MSESTSAVYQFGAFRLDAARRVLTRAGTVVPVQPKTFELLLLLAERPGYAVSKRELMAALWPDTFVEEANLSFQVSLLRRALGPEAAQLIETVPKHGYRFTSEVRQVAPPDAPGIEGRDARPRPSGRLFGVRPVHILVVAAVAVALAVAGYLVSSMTSPSASPPISASVATPLTAYPGFEEAPTLSPDGSQVAFAWNGPGLDNFDIYVKLVGPGEPWRLTKHPAHDDKPAWSPDGGRIAFFRRLPDNAADLMVIPALGGAERRIATVHPVYSSDRPVSQPLVDAGRTGAGLRRSRLTRWSPGDLARLGRRPREAEAHRRPGRGRDWRRQPGPLAGWHPHRVRSRTDIQPERPLRRAACGRGHLCAKTRPAHARQLECERGGLDSGRA